MDELRVLSAEMIKICSKNLPVERLEVKEELAYQIFEINKHKTDQIPDIAAQSSSNCSFICACLKCVQVFHTYLVLIYR